MSGGARSELPVALDAMGSDGAPGPEVDGALAARDRGQPVTLVGDRAALEKVLGTRGVDPSSVDVVHAAGRVAMDDDVALALRRQPDASVRVAARLVADGRAAGLVSAGSTGAVVGGALFEIGRVRGVRRPAVGAVLPVPGTDGVVLVDAGGSPDAAVDAVVGFARMGAALAFARGVAAPRVGLLNVGGEPGRGNAATRAAHEALTDLGEFIGNVEPGDVFAGACDVVVTDAFTGNVFLKTLEAVAVTAGLDLRGGGGGALVLGVRAPVVVAHGSADPAAIDRAVAMAADAAASALPERVAERLEAPASPSSA